MNYSQDDYKNDLKLSEFIFKKCFRKFEEHKEDLIQSSLLGLWQSRDNFDETKGFALSTYRYSVAKGRMLRFLVEFYHSNRKEHLDKTFISIYSVVQGTEDLIYAETLADESVDFYSNLNCETIKNIFDEVVAKQKFSKNNNLSRNILDLIKQGKSDMKISKILNCSRERCRQVRNKILPLFREKLKEYEFFN